MVKGGPRLSARLVAWLLLAQFVIGGVGAAHAAVVGESGLVGEPGVRGQHLFVRVLYGGDVVLR